jgi:GR25 family glycosyltransferase involved in LPS biosynthesis
MRSASLYKEGDGDVDLYFIGKGGDKIDIEDCNLNIYIIPAVIGAELPASTYFEHSTSYFKKYGKILTPGEVGVTLAHNVVYSSIIQRGRPGLIFEADISPTSEQLQFALKVAVSSKRDFIHFGIHPSSLSGTFLFGEFSEEYSLYKANRFLNFWGAFSYYLSPYGAQYLVDQHEKSFQRADDWFRLLQPENLESWYLPVFSHPLERGALQIERKSINTEKISKAYLRKLNPIDLAEKFGAIFRTIVLKSILKPIDPYHSSTRIESRASDPD